MLAFYPEFDVGTLSDCEVIICLDCSYSMRGLALEQAKKVALLLLRYLPTTCRFNVIAFGTDYKELFHCSQQRNSEDAVKTAQKFILSVQKPMGNTDFWRPLLSLNLLAPSKRIRNILLISDGHIQNEALTLKMVHQNVKHTRIFTCGVGSTANRHILRILAQYGGGAHEVFDKNTKFSWKEKILHRLTARALIGDYENGSLHTDESEHEELLQEREVPSECFPKEIGRDNDEVKYFSSKSTLSSSSETPVSLKSILIPLRAPQHAVLHTSMKIADDEETDVQCLKYHILDGVSDFLVDESEDALEVDSFVLNEASNWSCHPWRFSTF
ncbi:protein mono-ADP-ribosyltransferase PARP4-like isoform X2 [Carcharodon carcharias]|uniref:protein mono-ADP-ribosyltransferase PARP4-like isoform X2 n=1 Tax=Carcharodon carcharias TaxID=13397 RepID=UPI001B7F62E4|nr:protein mono-ADP-ribosyltransferase PARP4-like isoform X2 [Carcharodon carcharias]